MKIIWSPEAKEDYWRNIDYLIEEWSQREVLNFINSVEEVLEIITNSPTTFRPYNKEKYPNVYFMPPVPQITLFYRVHSTYIELIRFWNNSKDRKNLKF